MTAVADSSPLILLGKVQRLDLLHTLYGDIILPPAVVDEVLAKPEVIGPDLRAFVMAARVRPVQNVALARTLRLDLGAGEAEAIAVAAEVGDAILIMDDADARRVARGLGLRVTGVLGVLVEAKSRGVLSGVRPVLDALVGQGFWLGEPLRRKILDAVRE